MKLKNISNLQSLIETGYLFDFTRLLTICINAMLDKLVNCYFSEDLEIEFVVPSKLELDIHQAELFNLISHMCKLECCLSQTSTSRLISIYENGTITYKPTESTKYYIKLTKLFANYPVRRDTFSFLSFSNEIKLVSKIIHYLYPDNQFNLIHRQSKQYFKEKLIIIESFDLEIGTVHHFKVDKLAYKKSMGFAKIGTSLVNFSKQLEERNFKQSILFVPTSQSIVANSEQLLIPILEQLISCFKTNFQKQVTKPFTTPTVSNMKSSDSYKICKKQIVVPSNPANINNFHFKNDEQDPNTKISKKFALKMVSIDRKAFEIAKVISQVDRKFIILSVVVKKEVVLYCLDQHAADERIRIEQIIKNYHHTVEFTGVSSKFGIEQMAILGNIEKFVLEQARIEFRVIKDIIQFISIPRVIADASNTLSRCEDILSRFLNNQGFVACVLPSLASIACRSAIMFGDALSISQCQALVNQLKECDNPFVCAHGRPSIIPLMSFKKKQKIIK